MKVLYGINGIGNGHLSRSRLMVSKLEAAGADVTCLISGRAADPGLDLGQSGDILFRDGLNITFDSGEVRFLATALKIGRDLPFMLKDAALLDTSAYDLVITDFEPVTAWAAKLRGTPSIGIANQYAFQHDVPTPGRYSPFMIFMNNIVPADTTLGMHWDHFGQPILPPIHQPMEGAEADPKKILVYLNWETLKDITTLLQPFPEYDFHIYSPHITSLSDEGNLHFRPLSKDGFKKDFADCAGVIANAGFQTTTEALELGKKVLVKPVPGQKEQEANGLALEELSYGSVMWDLKHEAVRAWLETTQPVQIRYPDTAQLLTDWIMAGQWDNPAPLIEKSWSLVEKQVPQLPKPALSA